MALQTLETKICIIGAGPAGATTSLFLSKKQIPHIILDSAAFPRDKVCGDGLDLKVMRVLNQLDPAITEQVLNDENFSKAWGVSVIISKDKKYNLDLTPAPKSYPYFLVAKRAYFDNFLVSKIEAEYADFRQQTKVKKLVRQDGKWIISAQNQEGELEIHAELIVGADGDHSTVLRTLGERKINREHYIAGLRQYWKGVTNVHPNNYLEVYLPKSLPMAYLWIFPLPNGEANVGCGLASDLIAKGSIDLKKLFNKLITEDPAIAHRFRDAVPLEKPVGWGLPLASDPRNVYGDGYLLVGDAASMICPTTGEGIGPGMMSGYTASVFIERAVAKDCFDKKMFINYDREIYKRLQSDTKKYKFLRIVSPGLYNILVKTLSGLGVSRLYFYKNIARWMATTNKPIEVNM